mmetsp:Transcript_141893/g.272497  ORF Transcript_141893/g.272497 Transcript_141893/m.272497 type:complete len:137 (+) Transcript_141893:204-614(+)
MYGQFECGVCLNLCDDVTLLDCPGWHTFCRGCLQEWSRETCPYCQENCSMSSPEEAEKIRLLIDGAELRCIFAPRDQFSSEEPLSCQHVARLLAWTCNWKGKVSEWHDHLAVCGVAKKLRECAANGAANCYTSGNK